jgi:hypothetical protein
MQWIRDKLPIFGIFLCLMLSFPAIFSLFGIELDAKMCRKMCNWHPVAAGVWLLIMTYFIWEFIQSPKDTQKSKNNARKRRKGK